jgi:hypothetical protein
MIDIYTTPEQAIQAAVQMWLKLKDSTGLVPVVFETDSGFEPGTWPRARLEEMPEGAWIVRSL